MLFCDSFQGSQAEYIQYLEVKLEELTTHLQDSHGCHCPHFNVSSRSGGFHRQPATAQSQAAPLSDSALSVSSPLTLDSSPALVDNDVSPLASSPPTLHSPSLLTYTAPSTVGFGAPLDPNETLVSATYLPSDFDAPSPQNSYTSNASSPPASNASSPSESVVCSTETLNGSLPHNLSNSSLLSAQKDSASLLDVSLPLQPNASSYQTSPTAQSHGTTEGSRSRLSEPSKHGLDLGPTEQSIPKKIKLTEQLKKRATLMLNELKRRQMSTYRGLLEEIGLPSLADRANAFALLTGGSTIYQSSRKSIDTRGCKDAFEKRLLEAISTYMVSMEDSRLHARLLSFRGIVFTSMCAVLRHQGISKQMVTDMLRRGLGLGTKTNISRILLAPQWLGKLVTALHGKMAWLGHCDLVLIYWNRPISIYGGLTDYPQASIDFLTEALIPLEPPWASKSTSPSYERTSDDAEAEQGRYFFSIPLLVYYLFDCEINLGAICKGLNYGDAYLREIQAVTAISDLRYNKATYFPVDAGGYVQPSTENLESSTVSGGNVAHFPVSFPVDAGGCIQPSTENLESFTVSGGDVSHFPMPFPVDAGGYVQPSTEDFQSSTVSGGNVSHFPVSFPVDAGGCIQPSPSYNVALEGSYPAIYASTWASR